jgi:hypothetical protein
MRTQKWLLLATTAIFILSGIVCLSGCTEHQYEKGPVFFATLKTIGEGGPVKDDLIARGLYYSVPDGEEVVDIGGVKKLVDDGVYAIDDQGYLIFGPSYSPPP